jgi:hypothetical protein
MRDRTICTWLTTATYKAGIYAWATESRPHRQKMIAQPPAIFIVPGMRVGCSPYDAFLKSDLQCFFSESCLNATAALISTLLPHERPSALRLLNSSQFQPNNSVEVILQKEMVDKWQHEKNYSGYYHTCAPIECSYRVTRNNDFISVLTSIIGMYGGLSVVLRFISPKLVQFGRFIHKKVLKRSNTVQFSEENSQSNTS